MFRHLHTSKFMDFRVLSRTHLQKRKKKVSDIAFAQYLDLILKLVIFSDVLMDSKKILTSNISEDKMLPNKSFSTTTF